VTAISTATRAALQQAAAMVERDAALSDLVAVLDPKRAASLYSLAGTITRMIETHATGVQRDPRWRTTTTGRDRGGTGRAGAGRLPVVSQRQLYRLLGDLLD
jgi:hypothetical protein